MEHTKVNLEDMWFSVWDAKSEEPIFSGNFTDTLEYLKKGGKEKAIEIYAQDGQFSFDPMSVEKWDEWATYVLSCMRNRESNESREKWENKDDQQELKEKFEEALHSTSEGLAEGLNELYEEMEAEAYSLNLEVEYPAKGVDLNNT